METTIVYWGYIRIMENKMETMLGREENPNKLSLRLNSGARSVLIRGLRLRA